MKYWRKCYNLIISSDPNHTKSKNWFISFLLILTISRSKVLVINATKTTALGAKKRLRNKVMNNTGKQQLILDFSKEFCKIKKVNSR